MKTDPLKEFVMPDLKRIVLFGIFMSLLIGGILRDMTLSGQTLGILQPIAGILSIASFWEAQSYLLYPHHVLLVIYTGVSGPGADVILWNTNPLMIGVFLTYFYLLSCAIAYSVESIQNRRDIIAGIIRPKKANALLFLFMIATGLSFGQLYSQGYIAELQIGEYYEPGSETSFPMSFPDQLNGMFYMVLLPSKFLFGFFWAAVTLMTGNNMEMLSGLRWVLAIIELAYLYVLSGTIVYLWHQRKSRTVQALCAVAVALIVLVPAGLDYAYENNGSAAMDKMIDECMKMDGVNYSCLRDVALSYKEIGVCSLILEINLMDECYNSVCTAKQDGASMERCEQRVDLFRLWREEQKLPESLNAVPQND